MAPSATRFDETREKPIFRPPPFPPPGGLLFGALRAFVTAESI
jgi:hypothetical protein